MALEGRNEVELPQTVHSGESESTINDVEMEVSEGPQANERSDDNSEQAAETPQIPRTLHLMSTVEESPDVFQPKASKQPRRVKQPPKSPEKSPQKEDDANSCPICFEAWSNSGSHRLASLSCGHLFGRSCIERWLKAKGGNDKCPQCNAPAKKKDIRNIYARAIKTIDTTERDRALADLEKEKEARNRAEQAEAQVLLQFQLAKAECERVKLQLDQQRQQLLSYHNRKATCTKCGSALEDSTTTVRTHGETSSSQPSTTCRKCFVLQSSFQVTQAGARVMAFDRHHALLVISKPSPNQLFPGFGIVKVSSLDSKHCEFVRIHQKAVRDAAFNEQGDSLLLTAGMDKTLRMTSTLSNTVVQTYTTPVPAWSCTWNNSDTNYIYCGLQNGACLIFDVRNTQTYLTSLQNEAAVSCPVVSLAHVRPDAQSLLKPGGLLACKLEGACFWENTFGADHLPHHLILPEGSCTSLSFEPTTRHCMFSLRPSKSFQKSRHVVCQLHGNGIGALTSRGQAQNTTENNQNAENTGQGAGLCSNSVIAQCVGGSTKKLLSRSALFTCPDDANKLLAAAGDESSNATLVWDATNGKQLQKLPNQGGAVLDTTTFNTNGSEFLATIDEQRLTIYKWQ